MRSGSERFRIAVFGLGWWGPKLLRNLRQHPLVEKAIGVDVSREVCGRVANDMGCETSCKPAEILADPEIDGIIIATPPATHHPIAVAAFEAGKHVFMTKPPTTTIAELEDLVRRAEGGGRVLMMDSTFVYSEPVRKLKDLLDGGIMPDIRFVQSLRYGNDLRFHHISRLRNTMLKNGIDVVNDLIFHDLAILTYLFPDYRLTPTAVHESFSLSDDICDTAFVRLDATKTGSTDRVRGGSTAGIEPGTAAKAVDGGLAGHCECVSFPIHVGLSWTLPERKRELLIANREKQILYDDLKSDSKISIFHIETQQEEIIEHGQAEPLFLVVDHFLHCIKNRTRPLTDGRYMLNLMKTFAAVQALMENWVFSELYKRLPLTAAIHFWRSRAGGEVDFVVDQVGKLTALEVKSADLDRPRLSRAAHSFIDAYQPERFVVLNRSLETRLTIDNHPVDFQTPEGKW